MDKVWWNHITKAHKFFEDIVETAVKGSSMLLSLPASVPWKETLIEMIGERLQLENPKNAFQKISCPKEEPGEYLLTNYCKKEIRLKYRYGMSYAQFLGACQETVLNDRYIWISDVSKEKCEEWLEFIEEYNKNVVNKTPAIFILEINEEGMERKAKKGIKTIAFNQNIGNYDKYAFCALAASETNCKEYLRPYLAELVSILCSEDVELCAECVENGIEFLKNPYQTIKRIIETDVRSNGEEYQFNKTEKEMESLIWEVQLKTVFPLIEKYRKHQISAYTEIITRELPIRNGYGQDINEPEEVEIGVLYYLIGKSSIKISEKEYQELKDYRNARNNLAHMKILELGTVEQILKK